MKLNKITSIDDLRALQEIYEDDAIFEVLETGEQMTLPDMIFYFDPGQPECVTIQHI